MVFLLVSLLFVTCLLHVTIATAENFLLFPGEATELQLTETEWNMPPITTRGAGFGPIINFKTPTPKNTDNPTLETTSPADLIILFQQNGAPVDMASLEITAKKGFLKRDLTERIRPYIQGTSVVATDLQVPKGKFKIQIIIADIKGNQTSTEYRLKVGN